MVKRRLSHKSSLSYRAKRDILFNSNEKTPRFARGDNLLLGQSPNLYAF